MGELHNAKTQWLRRQQQQQTTKKNAPPNTNGFVIEFNF